MKAQILINFIIEYMPTDDRQIEDQSQGEILEPAWILHVDKASNIKGCGTCLILTNIDGMVIEYDLQFAFKASNNQAEYEALIARLKIAKNLDVKCKDIHRLSVGC